MFGLFSQPPKTRNKPTPAHLTHTLNSNWSTVLVFSLLFLNFTKAEDDGCYTPYENIWGFRCCWPIFYSSYTETCIVGDANRIASYNLLKISPHVDRVTLNTDLMTCKLSNVECVQSYDHWQPNCTMSFQQPPGSTIVTFGNSTLDKWCSVQTNSVSASENILDYMLDTCFMQALLNHCGPIHNLTRLNYPTTPPKPTDSPNALNEHEILSISMSLGAVSLVFLAIGCYLKSQCTHQAAHQAVDMEAGLPLLEQAEELSSASQWENVQEKIVQCAEDDPKNKSAQQLLALFIRMKEKYQCAISLDMPSNPVTLQCGHNFDQDALKGWLKNQNDVHHIEANCPCCRSPFNALDVQVNPVMKAAIEMRLREFIRQLQELNTASSRLARFIEKVNSSNNSKESSHSGRHEGMPRSYSADFCFLSPYQSTENGISRNLSTTTLIMF